MLSFLGSLLLHVSLVSQVPHFQQQSFAARGDGKISSIQQDGLGFMWIGSDEGLFRYNGHEYRQLFSADSLDHLQVSFLYLDSGDTLWVGTSTGHIYTIGRDQVLDSWIFDKHLPRRKITGIIKDETGRIWISTYGSGVFVQEGNNLDSLSMTGGLLEDEIYAMAIDSLQRIWAATDRGVSICQLEQGWQVRNLGRSDGLIDEIVYLLLQDEQRMWLGFQSGGIMGFDVLADSLIIPKATWQWGETTGMALKNGDIWISTTGGLLKYEDDHAYNNKHIAKEGASIDLIYLDNLQNIWIVENHTELSCADLIVEVALGEVGDIQAVLADQSGNVWVGTAEGLFSFIDDSFEAIAPYRDNIISLYEDPYGRIWIGTFGEGVIIWDRENNRTHRLSEAHGLKNGSIFSIAGNLDRVWLATLGGIVEVRQHAALLEEEIKFLQLDDINDLAVSFFYTVFVDSKGVVWFGTDGKGVIKLESEVFVSMQERDDFPAKSVYSFAEDEEGNIWIGTAEHGLFKWDGHTFLKFDQMEGARNLPISTLALDVNGQLVIGHPEGIDLFDPEKKIRLPYRDEVSVQSLDPSMNAQCKNDEGIWIGGFNKLVLIRPANTANTWPKMVIDEIRVLGEVVPSHQPGSFSNTRNYVQFDVAGLWFGKEAALSYAYKLEGYDQEWQQSTDRRASYGQLMPGNYTFKTAPVVAEQMLEDKASNFSFTIRPPLWQESWFIIICILLTGILLWWYQNHRERKISMEANMAKERIETQYEVLKAQINPHFLFNSFNTLASIVEDNPPQAIEYIEKLSDYYRSIIQLRNQKLIPLSEELDMVNNFIFLLNKRFGNHLVVDQEIGNIRGWIPPLSLQMLVENAVKHNTVSRRSPLYIKLKRTDDYIIVSNNLLPKRSPTQSTRFGLQNIQRRFDILSKKKVIIEKSDQYFNVHIPIINQHMSTP
ncbi:MAG: histidine kinase [Saprospiraceae bacterium]|nr:histidine kinase [Saprospiraceae bacterium]